LDSQTLTLTQILSSYFIAYSHKIAFGRYTSKYTLNNFAEKGCEQALEETLFGVRYVIHYTAIRAGIHTGRIGKLQLKLILKCLADRKAIYR